MKHSIAEVAQVPRAEVQGVETGCAQNFHLDMDLTIHSGSVGEVKGRYFLLANPEFPQHFHSSCRLATT
jgi:hypothetical protein